MIMHLYNLFMASPTNNAAAPSPVSRLLLPAPSLPHLHIRVHIPAVQTPAISPSTCAEVYRLCPFAFSVVHIAHTHRHRCTLVADQFGIYILLTALLSLQFGLVIGVGILVVVVCFDILLGEQASTACFGTVLLGGLRLRLGPGAGVGASWPAGRD